jgi:formylglycine-generating enzyme required for sulfatase activity
MPGKVGNYKARVFADDGQGLSGMVLVPSGYFNYQNTTPPIFLPSFLIDKYEVTNAQYCEFLNNADPTGSHYNSSMEINRTGSSGNYTYTTISGKENYPIRYVSFDDANALAQWRSQIYGGNYRLPTAQEWNKAAAWDPVQQHYYSYGFHRDTIDDCNWCNYSGCYGGPLPVGSFNGTGGKNDAYSYYGCYDMSGNVEELLSDTPLWGGCPWGGNNYVHLTRGGSWSSAAGACQTSSGNTFCYGGERNNSTGFRLVRDIQ